MYWGLHALLLSAFNAVVCYMASCYGRPHSHPPHTLPLTLAHVYFARSFDRTIGTFNVGPFSVPAGQEKAKLKVRVRLNLHGLVGLEGVQAVEEVTEEVEVPQPAAKAAGDAEMKDAAAAEAAGDAAAGAGRACRCAGICAC